MITQTRIVSAMIEQGAMTRQQFFEQEIKRWKGSETRKNQLTGDAYYRGKHDILERKRTAIGQSGELREVKNLPNNKIIDNQYAKVVDQKTNYLLGKPFTYQTGEAKGAQPYHKALEPMFNRKFKRTLQNLGEDSLNGGIGWLYIYPDEDGVLGFRRFAPYEVLPFWEDDEHTELDCLVRVYEAMVYEGAEVKTIERVEAYTKDGVEHYLLIDGELKTDPDNPKADYLKRSDGKGSETMHNWERIPIVAWKYNNEEIPLICKVKSLQDAINITLSDFQNNMQEDSRNTILIIRNYDGADLGEFRHNLAAYGAVKVRSEDGANGGVDALRVEVNAENYRTILEILKRAMIENAMGFDAKDLRSSTPNQMNIQSMYSDVDLDANGMETEFQASFEQLLWFINVHLTNGGKDDFSGKTLEVVFDRDMMMNESDAVENAKKSVGILSRESIIAHHPWVADAETELERLAKDRKEEFDEYRDAFPKSGKKPEGIEDAES